MWNTAGNTRACSRPDSRKRRWSRGCLKTGSGGSPSVSRRQTASNTGSPGFTGAARCRGAEALFLSGERLGGILRKGPAPRLAAGAQHLHLAGLVSERWTTGRGERKRHAGGLFRGRYAEPRLRMRHLGADRAAAADCGRQRRNGSGRRAAGAFISDGAVGSVAGVPAVRHAFYQGRQGLYTADPGPLPAGPAGRDQLYV